MKILKVFQEEEQQFGSLIKVQYILCSTYDWKVQLLKNFYFKLLMYVTVANLI